MEENENKSKNSNSSPNVLRGTVTEQFSPQPKTPHVDSFVLDPAKSGDDSIDASGSVENIINAVAASFETSPLVDPGQLDAIKSKSTPISSTIFPLADNKALQSSPTLNTKLESDLFPTSKDSIIIEPSFGSENSEDPWGDYLKHRHYDHRESLEVQDNDLQDCADWSETDFSNDNLEDSLIQSDAMMDSIVSLNEDTEEEGGNVDREYDANYGSSVSSVSSLRDNMTPTKRKRNRSAKKLKKSDSMEDRPQTPLKVRPNYFLGIKISNPLVHKSVIEVQESILEQCPELCKAIIDVATLHLTLFVVKISNEDDLNIACSALDKCHRVLEDTLNKEPINLTFKELGHFSHQTLYVKVIEDSNYQRLLDLTSEVRKIFIENDVNLPEEKEMLPHLTIAKLSKISRGKSKIRRIDTNLYESFKDKSFGNQVITRLEFSCMHKPKDERRYFASARHCELDVIIDEDVDHTKCCFPRRPDVASISRQFTTSISTDMTESIDKINPEETNLNENEGKLDSDSLINASLKNLDDSNISENESSFHFMCNPSLDDDISFIVADELPENLESDPSYLDDLVDIGEMDSLNMFISQSDSEPIDKDLLLQSNSNADKHMIRKDSFSDKFGIGDNETMPSNQGNVKPMGKDNSELLGFTDCGTIPVKKETDELFAQGAKSDKLVGMIEKDESDEDLGLGDCETVTLVKKSTAPLMSQSECYDVKLSKNTLPAQNEQGKDNFDEEIDVIEESDDIEIDEFDEQNDTIMEEDEEFIIQDSNDIPGLVFESKLSDIQKMIQENLPPDLQEKMTEIGKMISENLLTDDDTEQSFPVIFENSKLEKVMEKENLPVEDKPEEQETVENIISESEDLKMEDESEEPINVRMVIPAFSKVENKTEEQTKVENTIPEMKDIPTEKIEFEDSTPTLTGKNFIPEIENKPTEKAELEESVPVLTSENTMEKEESPAIAEDWKDNYVVAKESEPYVDTSQIPKKVTEVPTKEENNDSSLVVPIVIGAVCLGLLAIGFKVFAQK